MSSRSCLLSVTAFLYREAKSRKPGSGLPVRYAAQGLPVASHTSTITRHTAAKSG